MMIRGFACTAFPPFVQVGLYNPLTSIVIEYHALVPFGELLAGFVQRPAALGVDLGEVHPRFIVDAEVVQLPNAGWMGVHAVSRDDLRTRRRLDLGAWRTERLVDALILPVLVGRRVHVPKDVGQLVLELLQLRLDIREERDRFLEHKIQVNAMAAKGYMLGNRICVVRTPEKEVVESFVGDTVEVEDEGEELGLSLGAVRATEVRTTGNESPVVLAEFGQSFGEGILEKDLAVHPLAVMADYERVRLELPRLLALPLDVALTDMENIGVKTHGRLVGAAPFFDNLRECHSRSPASLSPPLPLSRHVILSILHYWYKQDVREPHVSRVRNSSLARRRRRP